MKKRIMVVLMCYLMVVLTACSNKDGETSNNNISQVEDSNKEDAMDGDCFVTIADGEESYEMQVSSYGEEFELPEPKGSSNGGEFVGWLTHTGLYAAKEMVYSEEFLSFSAVYTSPTEGLLIILDNMGNGYSTNMSEGEDFVVENPYTYSYSFDNNDYYIDCYMDQDGNRYDFDETVKIGKGECLILETVYSDDLSGAYKVSVSYNPPIDEDFFEESEYRYVKIGESISLEAMVEYDGFTIDGWYDAPEGGNLLCKDGENYTPSADVELFAHWNKN